MGTEWSSDIDAFADNLLRRASAAERAAVNQNFAEQLADRAHEAGARNVDGMSLVLSVESDDGGLIKLDGSEIHRIANGILAGTERGYTAQLWENGEPTLHRTTMVDDAYRPTLTIAREGEPGQTWTLRKPVVGDAPDYDLI